MQMQIKTRRRRCSKSCESGETGKERQKQTALLSCRQTAHLLFSAVVEDNFPSVPVFLHLKESLKVKERLPYLIVSALLCPGSWGFDGGQVLGTELACPAQCGTCNTSPLTVQHVDVHLISWNLIGQE